MASPIRTLFLDRDGIINEPVVRGSVVSSPRSFDEFRLTSDFRQLYEGIKGCALFVVSNQPDVARGLLAREVLNRIDESLQSEFAFREIIYCTHDDADQCNCRKPKPGMITQTLDKYRIKPDEAAIIGDSYKDILAGQAAGIGTIYCRRSYNSTISCKPDYIVDGLPEILTLPRFSALS